MRNLCAVSSILLLMLGTIIFVQDADALTVTKVTKQDTQDNGIQVEYRVDADDLTRIKVIKGKLTKPADYKPFGGEEVGTFKMKIRIGLVGILKIEMNKLPEKGYDYLVSVMDEKTGYRDVFTAYRWESKVIILRDLSLPQHGSVLFVTEHSKYITSNMPELYGETYVGAAPVSELSDSWPFVNVEDLEKINQILYWEVQELKQKGVPVVDHFVDREHKVIVFVLEGWNQEYADQIVKILPRDTLVNIRTSQ